MPYLDIVDLIESYDKGGYSASVTSTVGMLS